MLGYMTSKGWRLSREDAEDFKATFPEVPEDLIELSVSEEAKDG